MKKSIDIIGLPVVAITQGKEVGRVKQFVVNPGNGSVAALVVDDGKWYLGARLILMSSVTALGEYAVTISHVDDIISVQQAPDIEILLEGGVAVNGSNVITNTGRMFGKVVEIQIDESGKITACDIQNLDGETTQVSADRVLTYGKEVLIIADENYKTPADVKTGQQEKVQEPSSPVQPHPAPVSKTANQATETKTPPSGNDSNDESAKKLDERHRKFLLGKKASRRIETDNGMLIVDQGGEITEEVLQKAKLAGKFVELSMNIQ